MSEWVLGSITWRTLRTCGSCVRTNTIENERARALIQRWTTTRHTTATLRAPKQEKCLEQRTCVRFSYKWISSLRSRSTLRSVFVFDNMAVLVLLMFFFCSSVLFHFNFFFSRCAWLSFFIIWFQFFSLLLAPLIRILLLTPSHATTTVQAIQHWHSTTFYIRFQSKIKRHTIDLEIQRELCSDSKFICLAISARLAATHCAAIAHTFSFSFLARKLFGFDWRHFGGRGARFPAQINEDRETQSLHLRRNRLDCGRG